MQFKKLLMLAAVAMLAACGGAGDAPVEEAAAVEEAPMEEVADAASEVMTIVAVDHEVSDYAAFKAAYNEKSDPESRLSVLQGTDNPNMVHVAEFTASHEEAMARFSSEEMMTAMAEAGVIGEPEVHYLNMVYLNKEAAELAPGNYVASITHEVSDYDSWRVAFDADNDNRMAAGLECRGLGRVEGNENMIVVVLGVNDLEACKAMLADPAMMEKMQEAGVTGEPTVKYWVVPAEDADNEDAPTES